MKTKLELCKFNNCLISIILIALYIAVSMAKVKNDARSFKEELQTVSPVETKKKAGELRSKIEGQRLSTPDRWPVNLTERQQIVETLKFINHTNLSINNESIRTWENTNRVDGKDNDDEEYDYGDDDHDNTFEDDDENYDGDFSSQKSSREISNNPRHVRSYSLRNVGDQMNGYIHLNRIGSSKTFDLNNEDDYQSDQPIGALTNYKEQHLGNPASVQNNFDFLKKEREAKLDLIQRARINREKVYATAACKVPKLRLIYPSDITKNYDPRAALLHRCDDSTGCCHDPHMSCQALKQDTVHIAFWESSPNVIRPKLLEFQNHTECGCVSPSQRRKRNSSVLCQCPEYFTNFGTQRDQYRDVDHVDNADNDNDQITPASSSSSCRCDCHLNNSICQRLKNGEEGFPMSERKCISSNTCNEPICNYGLYNRYKGRCPSPDSVRQTGDQQQHRGHRGHG